MGVGQPQPRPVVPAPPPETARQPVRIEPAEGTPYGLAIYAAPTVLSGPSVGALVAGIAAILVALVVGCFGMVSLSLATEGQAAGGGAAAAAAFTALTLFLGAAGIGLGAVGMRQTNPVRRPPGTVVRGRGMAVAGLVCGAVGVVLALCSLGLAGVAVLS